MQNETNSITEYLHRSLASATANFNERKFDQIVLPQKVWNDYDGFARRSFDQYHPDSTIEEKARLLKEGSLTFCGLNVVKNDSINEKEILFISHHRDDCDCGKCQKMQIGDMVAFFSVCKIVNVETPSA